jgi:hypothetical protein
MQRSYIAASAAASRGEAVCTGGSAAAALPHTMIKRTHKPRIVKGLRLREVLAVLGQAQYVRRICEDWEYFFAPTSSSPTARSSKWRRSRLADWARLGARLPHLSDGDG